MPRRNDIHKILILGSGPIVIGQAAEFDYSGVQACKVLREEGYEVVLVNSNPATIMTDPEFAEATYIEPLLPGPVTQVIERERPDALLGTLGGQTALNLSKALHDDGTLEKYGVELIGANYEAIACAEDRELFGEAMAAAGLRMPKSAIATSAAEAQRALVGVGLPCVVRPAFTLGGRGGGIARTSEEFERIVATGIEVSPIGQVLLDESVIGWGEFELEVMRDAADNVVIVCSIENVDPMGVHTGDSVTVAPAMTLTDREYQHMRDVAIQIIRAVGVDTGGCNIQFAVDPTTGRMVVIEMNPRVSRSSALASKATGFPIAKIATRLAIGYTLDEIPNDITGQTPASFEPALDYVVVKIPRFAFEKFPGADTTLTTHMKSVGEAMAIGRSFCEALQKAQRSLESTTGPFRFNKTETDADLLLDRCRTPHDGRLNTMLQALRAGASPQAVAEVTGIDPWFVDQVVQIHEISRTVAAASELDTSLFRLAKSHGFSDAQLAEIRGIGADQVRALRHALGVRPVYHAVDTCAAEFAARTPYLYSTYDEGDEVPAGDTPKVIILGSGPNRIGQGIEFD
ncbi:MAG TPA: carbamoyl-phosphate synthase large subunit, partial [Solirubrobacteraceae bacterium]|nr:carbamoyl-phosphate synthase large subunit [Solirubrobacteraceae bacterium]